MRLCCIYVRRNRLEQARKAAGKSQEKIAEECEVDRTTVGRWESGEITPQPDKRAAIAHAYRVSLSELASMLSSMPVDAGEIPDWLAEYLNMEQSATSIRVHEPKLVDGLLQTPDYVEAVVRCVGLAGVTDDYVLQNINQRRHRQQRVQQGDVALDVIQSEQVLHVQLGSPDVMAKQLRSLAESADLPNVTVRIMPFSAGQYEARRLDSFSVLGHPWGNPTVCLSGYGGTRFIRDAEETAYFVEALDRAAAVALSPADSVALIRDMAQTWEAQR